MKQYTISLFSQSPNPALNKNVETTKSPTWDGLPEILCQYNWSPAVYSEGIRNLTNYRGHPHLFAFDIDGEMTLPQAKEAFKDYQCLIQTSRNHQRVKNAGTPSEKPACDRFRVVFVLSEPIATDEDFKATWEAYHDEYPLDPQTKSSSMFFFKSTETVFNNPCGKPLPVIKASTWNEVKSAHYAFVRNDGNAPHGMISELSREFLTSGAPAGMFNLRLFKCAVDHLEQRYSQDEFLQICQKSAENGAFSSLDSHDLATVSSAFNREPKYGVRSSGLNHVEQQKQEIASRIMDGEFIQAVMPDVTLWYQIVDFENKEVKLISNHQLLERHIERELQKPENQYETTKRVENETGKRSLQSISKRMTIKEVLEKWTQAGNAYHVLPEAILWRGEPGWCNKRFTADFTPGQPTPAWDQFLCRLSAPEVFQAWVFSCFMRNHETRQALWLLGKHGEDGKTRVTEAIASFFGSAAAVISGNQIKNDSRFMLSQFVGKRLAIYPDCKYTKFPSTELFRNLTGGDLVGIELKGQGFLHQKLEIKVLIASNYEPETTGANYDQSRLIVIDVAESKTKDDPTWANQLKAEMPAFLGNAQVFFCAFANTGAKSMSPRRSGTGVRTSPRKPNSKSKSSLRRSLN